MPNIKITGREQTIGFAPGPQLQEQDITPKIADTSAPWAALAKGSENISDVANKIMIAKNRVDLSAAKVDYSTAAMQIQADAAKETDPEKAALHKDRLTALDEEYAKRYPNVWNQIVPYANHLKTTAGINIDAHSMKLTAEQVAADAVRVVTAYGNTMAYARTPEEAAAAEAYIDRFLQDAVSVHAMTPAQAEHEKLKATQNASLAQASDDIRQNPEVAKSSLMERDENGSFINYRYLSPGQRIQAVNAADHAMRSNTRRFYEEQNRYQDEVRYKVYDLMDSKKPAFEILNFIDRQTVPDPTTGFRGLDAREAFALKEKVRKGDGEEGGKTDFRVWQKLYQRGLDGNLSHSDITAAWGNGLSTTDAKSLSTMLTKSDEKNKKETSAEERRLDATLKASVTEFSEYAKRVIGDPKDAKSQDVVGFLIHDVHRASQYVRNEKDLKWFEEYKQTVMNTAIKNHGNKALNNYLKLLKEQSQLPELEYSKKYMEGGARRMDTRQGSKGVPTSAGDILSRTFGGNGATAQAIIQAESGGDPRAVNKNENGTTDRGLFQINSIHTQNLKKAGIIKTEDDLFDPQTNIAAAKFLYEKYGWSPWNASRAKWEKQATGQGRTIALSSGKKIRVVE